MGAELRRLRERAGLTGDEVGEHLECHGSKISRIETGRSGVRRRDLRDMLDLYGVADEAERAALLSLARDSRKKGWWHTYGKVISDRYTDFIGLENDAASVRAYESQLIHGLLQTESYARAVVSYAPGRETAGEIEAYVAVRMARQKRLTESESFHLWVVLGESAIRQRVGGPQVMREQLEHLSETAQLSNVTVQVLPFAAGAHAGMDGPFIILAFPELASPDVVYVDNLTSGLYVEEDEEVKWYNLAFDHLRAAALSPKDSVEVIGRVAEEMQ
ncbi:MAG: helix-turn-helix domain-containing protein [Carbonactinosporaceae bacterium]